jgi:hypothetical protein
LASHDGTSSSDTITVNASDSFGVTASPQQIAVTPVGSFSLPSPRGDYSISLVDGTSLVVTPLLPGSTGSVTLDGVSDIAFNGTSVLATFEPAGAVNGELSAELWVTGLAALTGAPPGPALPLPTEITGPMFAAGRAGGTGGGGDADNPAAAAGAGDVALLAQMSQTSVVAASAAPAAAPPAPSVGAEAIALVLAHAPS